MGRLSLFGLVVTAVACAPISSPAEDAAAEDQREPAAAAGLRSYDVLQHADDWLGRELVVDVYEPIYGPVNSSSAPDNGYDVEVEDVGTDILNLVPDGRDITTLPADLEPPFRVRATLRRDDKWEKSSGRTWRVLEIHEMSPLKFPRPVRAESAKAILRRPRRWHGRYVELEGDWGTGFEASYIDRIWIDLYPGVEVFCEPPSEPDEGRFGRGYETHRVRLVGYVYTMGQYGHLGGGKGNLVATKVTFLDTPGCKPDR